MIGAVHGGVLCACFSWAACIEAQHLDTIAPVRTEAGARPATIMNSPLFKAWSHQIDDVPIAEEALRFSETKIPNACFECHSSKDVPWVQAQLNLWKPISAVETSHAMQ